MQRVRIGLTGLAFVFVLVLVAAVFSNAADDSPPITPNGLDQLAGNAAAPPAGAEPEPKEPLAKLGVAPGNADANASDAPLPAAPTR